LVIGPVVDATCLSAEVGQGTVADLDPGPPRGWSQLKGVLSGESAIASRVDPLPVEVVIFGREVQERDVVFVVGERCSVSRGLQVDFLSAFDDTQPTELEIALGLPIPSDGTI
jgi:hypothetical protein